MVYETFILVTAIVFFANPMGYILTIFFLLTEEENGGE